MAANPATVVTVVASSSAMRVLVAFMASVHWMLLLLDQRVSIFRRTRATPDVTAHACSPDFDYFIWWSLLARISSQVSSEDDHIESFLDKTLFVQ